MARRANKPPTFFKTELVNVGGHHELDLGGAKIILYIDYARSIGAPRWVASMLSPGLPSPICLAKGRTKAEALRALERKTLKTVREIVNALAPLLRAAGWMFNLKFPRS